MWETCTATPCEILKVPHHASLSSTTRKLLNLLQPKTAVVCVAARRPDERPHPYIISLLREFTDDVRFTDAWRFPAWWSRYTTSLCIWNFHERRRPQPAAVFVLFCLQSSPCFSGGTGVP